MFQMNVNHQTIKWLKMVVIGKNYKEMISSVSGPLKFC